jgi:hypothetical protein
MRRSRQQTRSRRAPLILRLVFLISLPLFDGICVAASSNSTDQATSAPSAAAYAYVGSYVNLGSANGYLTGFAVASDGSTQPIPGSPFSGPSFLLTRASSYLFATDGPFGGNSIVTYTRASDGSLKATSVVREPTNLPWSGGMYINALNPDRSGQTLNTVITCGSCNSYILPWTIGTGGQLSYIGGLSEAVSGPAKWAGVFTFSPDDRYAYTVGWGDFSDYRRIADGTLSFLLSYGVASPPPQLSVGEQVCYPGDVAASAAGYVVLAWYGSTYWCDNNGYLLGAYTVNSDGTLALVPGLGVLPVVYEWSMEFDPTGTYLALAGAVDEYTYEIGGIQIYKLAADGKLSAVGSVQQPPGAPKFIQVGWDNANHLYALTGDDFPQCAAMPNPCGLYIFNSSNGVLTPAPGSPHPISNAIDLAVLPAS